MTSGDRSAGPKEHYNRLPGRDRDTDYQEHCRDLNSTTGYQLPSDLITKVYYDALGRVRSLMEWVDSSSLYYTGYSYNQDSELTLVELLAPGFLSKQKREFQYSAGGFLENAVEPERTTTFLGYDAAGNTRRTTGAVTLDYEHDIFVDRRQRRTAQMIS